MIPLKVSNLTKSFSNVVAVNNLSLEIKKGEIFGLLGPNGAGKTTFISVINTLLKADKGDVSIFGHSIFKEEKCAKVLIGVVPQEIMTHGYFNVEEVLRFQAGYYGKVNMQGHIDYLLKKLDLWEHRFKRARALSGGMRRRLLIAKALVHRPKLLLLDEPTAGVDVEIRSQLWGYIKELNRKEELTILLTTHYLEEAEELCDRIGIIDKGKLQLVEETTFFVRRVTFRLITLFLKEELPNKVTSSFLVSQKDKVLVFKVPQELSFSDLIEEAKLSFSMVVDIKIKEGSLEDAFLHIIGDNNK